MDITGNSNIMAIIILEHDKDDNLSMMLSYFNELFHFEKKKYK